jgi:hypothetical protein
MASRRVGNMARSLFVDFIFLRSQAANARVRLPVILWKGHKRFTVFSNTDLAGRKIIKRQVAVVTAARIIRAMPSTMPGP